MYTKIISATMHGLEAISVEVEVDVRNGLPGFYMVGSLTSQVREAQYRVRTALYNLKVSMPPQKVTVNLSPGDVTKTGTGFDLPIAAGILEILKQIPTGALDGVMIVGEIGLEGRVRGVPGVLSMAALAKRMGCHAMIVPRVNLDEAEMVEGLAIAGVESLEEFLCVAGNRAWSKERYKKVDNKEEDEVYPDFSEVKGQIGAKRASLIAAAGFHNLLFLGPPGSGKTMLAQRIVGILPKLSLSESLELTEIYSVAGLLPEKNPRVKQRPFRSPHHTITPQALGGGGRIPTPGEITLAHRGILFLDELPEMSRMSLELLRQPLEEKKIWISRVGGRYVFPADFLLVGAMNGCPCGHYPDRNKCRCTEYQIKKYLNKISQPLLDRMDICMEITMPRYEELRDEQIDTEWTTEKMKQRVWDAQSIQKARFEKEKFQFNSQIPAEKIPVYCILSTEAEKLFQLAFSQFGLSGRGCNRILRVARTIADLEGSQDIMEAHIAEAIGCRSFDKEYWRY